MSIEKDNCGFVLVCDNCGDLSGMTFDDFYEAVEAKDALGWKSKKVRGEWEDWCDECCEEG